MKFDPATRSFTGRTPTLASLTAPPQRFGIRLVGSELAGYEGVEFDFDLVVGAELIYFKEQYVNKTAPPNREFLYKISNDSVLVSGQPMEARRLESFATNTTESAAGSGALEAGVLCQRDRQSRCRRGDRICAY